MYNTLNSEMYKAFTVRWPYLVGVIGLALTTMGMWAAGGPQAAEAGLSPLTLDAQKVMIDSSGMVGMLAMVAGAVVMAGDFRHRTLTSTLIVTPQRSKLLVAKWLTGGVVAFVIGLLIASTAVVAANYALQASEVEFLVPLAESVELVARTAGVGLALGLFGAGIAATVQNQAAAIGAAFGASIVLEPIVAALSPTAGRYGIMQVAKTVAGAEVGPEALGIWQSAGVLVLWVAVANLIGYLRFSRSDL